MIHDLGQRLALTPSVLQPDSPFPKHFSLRTHRVISFIMFVATTVAAGKMLVIAANNVVEVYNQLAART